MSNQLAFGDIVYIEFDNLILFANDVYNPTLHLVTPKNIEHNSFRNGLFKLYPNFSYKDTNQVEQLKDQLELLKSLNPTETFAAEQLEKDIQIEKQTLEERENKLEDINQKMYEEGKGKPIIYGHKVQLFHIESQCFVSLSRSFNKDGTTINLELTKEGSKNLYFTFMPKLAFNQEGQIVEYDTPVKLVSCKTETFLTKGAEVDLTKIRTDLNPPTNTLCSANDFPAILPRRKEPLYQAEKVFHTGMSLKEVPENTYVRKFLSINDDEKIETLKAFKNGDYVRISNDKHFLTIYKGRSDKVTQEYFQSFGGNYDYKYNNLYTLFQIFEVPNEKVREGGSVSNPSNLPEGKMLEYEENKKYTFKQVISGNYLAYKSTGLGLIPLSEAKGAEKATLVRRGVSKASDKQIDRNSILQFKFTSENAKDERFLSLGLGIKIPNVQLDKNTVYFFGFENTDNYLNKWLRPERFKVDFLPVADEVFSSFKLVKVTDEEVASILLAESFANKLQSFYDLFDLFVNQPQGSGKLKELNEAMKSLNDICSKFSHELYENEYQEETEEILVPHSLRQTLLREFRIYDIMYAILSHMTGNDKILSLVKDKIGKSTENQPQKESQENKVIEEDMIVLANPDQPVDWKTKEVLESIDENTELNLLSFLQLAENFKKIIFISFKKNDLNHIYSCQFARIPIRGIVYQQTSVFSLARPIEKLAVLEVLLPLCKEGLWDSDLDALGQLNHYEGAMFDCLDKQTDYHTIYLRLLAHISNSKAPNFKNSIRDNLAFNYLSKSTNLSHLFPSILEDGEKLYLEFRRKKDTENKFKICITDLAQATSPKGSQAKTNLTQNETLMTYFQKSLELLCALASIQSQGFNFKIIRFYSYPLLIKMINLFKTKTHYRDIRIAISDLISLMHQEYFAVPFVQLPTQLQILEQEEGLKEINQTIQEAMKTIVSEAEIDFLKEEEAEEIIMALKNIESSEEQTSELLKLIELNPTVDQQELARIILDGIKKIFESPLDLEFNFLKKAREIVVRFIKQAIEKNSKLYFDFIKYALEVFKQMEDKTISFAAAEISDVLKTKYMLPSSKISKEKKKTSKIRQSNSDDVFNDFGANTRDLLEEGNQENARLTSKKIAPMDSKVKELSTREKNQQTVMPNVVELMARKWKTGEVFFYGNDNNLHQFNQIDIMHKKLNTGQTMTMLLDIITFNQEHLLSDVIQQLRRVSSFESNLYKELDKLIIIQDYESVKKTIEIIKITFRLTEIYREIRFCKDNLISIEEDKFKPMLNEVYESYWKLFFIIYDVSKHFRYDDPTISAEQRFRDAFEQIKKIRWDYCIKLKPEAISKSFQKIFNLLKTYQAVIQTQDWLLEKTQGFDEAYHVHMKTLRLNFLILTAFVYKNKENQNMCSTEKGIIRQFYNQHFMNQSPDAMFIFSEMLRENKKLLKLVTKYQYDITMFSFVGTVTRTVSQNSSNGYLTATIMSFHFLCRALIPRELYNPLSDLKIKWVQISNVTTFEKFNLLHNSQTENLPYGYYEVRETMVASLENFDYLASNSKNLNEIQAFLSFEKWIGFFQTPNYLLQYELKNLLCKCMVKFYFENENKIKLLENEGNCLSLMCSIIADLVFFRSYMEKKREEHDGVLQKLIGSQNFITNHENYKIVRTHYEKAKELDFEKKTLRIFLEDISLHNLLREYIYEGCLDLFFNVLLKEVEFCKEIRDAKAEYPSIISFALELIDDILNYESDDGLFPYSKFEKFLNKASTTKDYFPYRSKIIDLTSKFHLRSKLRDKKKNLKVSTKSLNAAENFSRYITPLYNFKKENKEQNMKQVAEHIAEHPKAKEIIKEIVMHFKRDINKLEQEEIVFILRLLRKYIEIENTNNPTDEPLYMWKEITHSDLRKIEKIQNHYRDLGLSEILFSFFTFNDPTIFRETLLLGLAYMYGGNLKVQQDFFENFKKEDENKVLSRIGAQLKSCYEFFRLTENKRINVLYTNTHKALFDYLKGKTMEKEVDIEELQMKVTKLNIDKKYMKVAEKSDENELFILILTFLQGLCEGQYRDMQLFLREQKIDGRIHPKSFDFLGFLRHSINSYYKVLNRYNLSIGTKVLDVITELTQGEVHENIAVILHKTFIYDLCRVLTDFNTRYHTLPRGFGLNIFHENFGEFKSKIIFLFKTMLENKNEVNTLIIKEHLDKIGLMRALEHLMTEFVKRNRLQKNISSIDRFIFSLNNEDFKDILGDAVNIYIIFRYIWDDQNEFNEKMRELIKEMDKDKQDFLDKIVFTVFRKLVKSIEIVVETKSPPLMRIWFPVIAVCHYLNKDAKYQFTKYVDRSNSQTKISSLINSTQEFLPQMDTDYQARNRIFGFNLLNVYYFSRFISNLLALVITIINVATYKYEDDDTYQEDRFTNATLVMNIVQIVIGSLLVLLWLVLLRKRNQSVMWERYVDQNIKEKGFLPPSLKNKLENGDYKELSEEDCMTILSLRGANSTEFKEMQKFSVNYKQIALKYYILESYFAIASKDFFWHCIYLGIAIGSVFHPLVAVFQILDIAFRVDTIKQIYSSISRNVNQFLWTLFLLVLTNVIYSFIGFFFMNDKFVSEDDPLCETAFSCLLNVLNLGLRNGGGIADVIGSQPYLSDEVGLFIARVVFDLSFFIIMIILLLNLIFGMIIDAFGDLRDQKTSNEEDEKNVCFICGIERSEFEKHMNFEEHVIDEHNMWAYVYYIAYLVEKQKTSKNEMTDIENFVIDKYVVSNYEWIPVSKSLTLEKIYKKEQGEKEDELENIKSTLSDLQIDMKEIGSQFRNIVPVIGEIKGFIEGKKI